MMMSVYQECSHFSCCVPHSLDSSKCPFRAHWSCRVGLKKHALFSVFALHVLPFQNQGSIFNNMTVYKPTWYILYLLIKEIQNDQVYQVIKPVRFAGLINWDFTHLIFPHLANIYTYFIRDLFVTLFHWFLNFPFHKY